jgi:hypothetical protein
MYTDGRNGRSAVGILMSYFGWDGRDDYDAASGIFTALDGLKLVGINEDLLINLNDSGYTLTFQIISIKRVMRYKKE